MSYIQIEIGGKLRGLKFNKMAQLILEEKLRPGNLMSGVYGLVYGGLQACCFAKDEPEDFTFEDVCDWTDSLTDEVLIKVQSAYQETEAYKKGAAYKADLEDAKKKDLPKSKPSRITKQNVLK